MRQTPQQPAATAAPSGSSTAAAPKVIVVPPLSLALAGRFEYQPAPGVKRGVWRSDDDHAHLADKAFEPVRLDVLKRDNHTCRYCMFRASKFQEVHHVDDNHRNNDANNLLTVCNLCHQVFHLGMCGMRNSGIIAAIPELSQVEINHFARAYFVTKMMPENVVDKNTKDKLTGLYALLRNRADALKKTFAMDISSPLVFANMFAQLDDEAFASRGALMQDLRILPTQQAFNEGQLKFYEVNCAPTFKPENWLALTRQLVV